MTHCPLCGTPVSYTTRPQSLIFAALPPATAQQTSSDAYEQHTYTQSLQQGQDNGMNYTNVIGPVTQNVYRTSSPVQQPPSMSYASAQTHIASTPQNVMQHQPIKKRRWDGLFLLAIVVCVLLLFGIGAYKLVRIANTTSTVKQVNTPSGNTLVPATAAILKDAQTSSDIDNTLAPVQITKTFMANQRVYVTFTITSGKQDGSIEAKWYADGQVVASTILHHTHENTHGVFSNIYITATPDGAVELYWCTQPNCRDAQLAQVVHFVINPVSTAFLSLQRISNKTQYFG